MNETSREKEKLQLICSAMLYTKEDLPEEVDKEEEFLIFIPKWTGFKHKDASK